MKLTEVGNERFYEFIHLSFQEFLIGRLFARKIVEHGLFTGDDLSFFDQHKYEKAYQLVWVYTAGIIRTQSKYWKQPRLTEQQYLDDAIYNYCDVFLSSASNGRDLYGVYELELLVRFGKEMKWPESDVFVKLLEYLGRWTMGIAYLDSDADLDQCLQHLTKIFASCPLATAKVRYNGHEQLFNFPTLQSRMPPWAEILVNLTNDSFPGKNMDRLQQGSLQVARNVFGWNLQWHGRRSRPL